MPGREKDQPVPSPGAHKVPQKCKLSSISGKDILPPLGALAVLVHPVPTLSRHKLLDRD